MTPRISFPGKRQRYTSLGGFFTDGSGHVFIGKDWALQNEIDENKQQTKGRSCYRECQVCGCCANSCRDGSTYNSRYDDHVGRNVSCGGCEKFRFCDCRNGYMRNAHGDAEPFTPDVVAALKATGGRPYLGM